MQQGKLVLLSTVPPTTVPPTQGCGVPRSRLCLDCTAIVEGACTVPGVSLSHCVLCAAIFGQSLEQTLLYEQKTNTSGKVPHIIDRCVTYLRLNGLHEEGLFRCGSLVYFAFIHMTKSCNLLDFLLTQSSATTPFQSGP